jgi:hypothetical protein
LDFVERRTDVDSVRFPFSTLPSHLGKG